MTFWDRDEKENISDQSAFIYGDILQIWGKCTERKLLLPQWLGYRQESHNIVALSSVNRFQMPVSENGFKEPFFILIHTSVPLQKHLNSKGAEWKVFFKYVLKPKKWLAWMTII